MLGHRFTQFVPTDDGKPNFEKLLKLFLELLNYTNGDVPEALDWMNQLDAEHGLTDDDYGMGDFIRDLEEKGYIRRDPKDGDGAGFNLAAKGEQSIRQQALEQIFGQLRKSGRGNHGTKFTGHAQDNSYEQRPYAFGDLPEDILMTESLRNSLANHGLQADGGFHLTDTDLVVNDREYLTQTSTVLMIDISHSMILYGEDRITPAKKVAMALSELILTKYPKDTLDVMVFGNEAWPISIKDLPYLQVGPYHTNTVAGLELALELLRRRRSANKQIFMITDGKPTCLKQPDGSYYRNSFGLDKRITGRCYNMAAQAKRLGVRITTFMIVQDPYLQRFVHKFTETNAVRAYYSSLNGLGEYILEDFVRNRTRRVR